MLPPCRLAEAGQSFALCLPNDLSKDFLLQSYFLIVVWVKIPTLLPLSFRALIFFFGRIRSPSNSRPASFFFSSPASLFSSRSGRPRSTLDSFPLFTLCPFLPELNLESCSLNDCLLHFHPIPLELLHPDASGFFLFACTISREIETTDPSSPLVTPAPLSALAVELQ